MTKPVVLDLETQYSFREKGKDPERLKVSVVGIYDYRDNQFKAFFEDELNKLWPILEKASLIIGFNIRKFDLPVLSAYYVGDLFKFPILDILDEIKKSLGKRISLNELSKETLGEKKSAHGFQALDFYRKGEFEKLKNYCLNDVRLTRDLYEFGKREGWVFYPSARGKTQIKVNWGTVRTRARGINLTLPI